MQVSTNRQAIVINEQTENRVSAALQAATGCSALPRAQGLELQCPREHKMAVLAALAPLGAQVRDVRLIEPSLEDMFFGLSA